MLCIKTIRKNRVRTSMMVLGLCGLVVADPMTVSSVDAAIVQGRVACDNWHALFTGSAAGSTGSLTLIGGGTGWGSPVSYSFNTRADYLYLACWSDDVGAQGLLHDLSVNGAAKWSGSPDWEVYPTDVDLDNDYPGGAPSINQMSEHIALANASDGWEAPAVGEANDGVYYTWWGVTESIPAEARWIWYDSGLDTSGFQFVPFRYGFDHREFLIFRLELPHPISTAHSTWGTIKALYD